MIIYMKFDKNNEQIIEELSNFNHSNKLDNVIRYFVEV